MPILTPGNPEFQKILAGSTNAFKNYTADDIDMSSTASALPVTMTTETYPGFELSHAVIQQSDTMSKIVMHFKKLSSRKMESLSKFMYEQLTMKIKPRAAIQAGPSPTYRGQWDLILMHVPIFESEMIYRQLLELVKNVG